ncbi:MAG: DUF61 family protein [Candidatus Omnitrophica bacterium]|nr:DUF61 family protein [Candidatus Omnitrophota bacterium]
MENLLSLEEVKSLFESNEEQINQLIQQGKLHVYKIGGTYLRFRKDEVLTLKQELYADKKTGLSVPWFLRIRDFWRFNNFYILSIILIAVLFYFVSRS